MTTATATHVSPHAQVDLMPEEDLTIADRCDRCGKTSQAFFKFKKTFSDGFEGVILMCAHHGRKHEPVAVADGWEVYDFSHRLNEKPTDPSIDDI